MTKGVFLILAAMVVSAAGGVTATLWGLGHLSPEPTASAAGVSIGSPSPGPENLETSAGAASVTSTQTLASVSPQTAAQAPAVLNPALLRDPVAPPGPEPMTLTSVEAAPIQPEVATVVPAVAPEVVLADWPSPESAALSTESAEITSPTVPETKAASAPASPGQKPVDFARLSADVAALSERLERFNTKLIQTLSPPPVAAEAAAAPADDTLEPPDPDS